MSHTGQKKSIICFGQRAKSRFLANVPRPFLFLVIRLPRKLYVYDFVVGNTHCGQPKLFSIHQNAFNKGRNIMDGVLFLHEHVKHVGIILKLDFEKVYDKLNWDFLQECHKAKGFPDKIVWLG
jgi:hypothetical protein